MENLSLIFHGKIYSIFAIAKNTFMHMANFSLIYHGKCTLFLPTSIHMASFSLICHGKIYSIFYMVKILYSHGKF